MAEALDTELQLSPELQMLNNNRDSGYNYQFRRYEAWTETYDFYRGTVIINRLTQRQSVHIPLMKTQITTYLKDVDDMPVLYFENLDNDKQAELFKNEYWTWTVAENNMEIQDIVDKRQVMLFGRSFDQWQIVDGKIKMTVQDPIDFLVDRYVDPFNLHSARYLIHTNIFVPLATLKQNTDYDQDELSELEMWYATQQGIIKLSQNEKILIEKNRKLADIGVLDAYSPVLGETYVEMALHFVKRPAGETWTDEDGTEQTLTEDQIVLYVEAEQNRLLMKKPLEKVIGETKDHFFRTHYPYVSWAGDLERQDFWSDGIGDIIREANKIVDVWFSQLVENRTLRSFGMNYYDATIEGFQPQTMQPMPFGWYGMPGKPQDVFQKVDIPDLTDSLEEIQFVIQTSEKATGANSTEQGVQNERNITLGEVQLALGEAKERIKGMSKFYTPAWKERGMMFIKLIEAAPDKLDAVKIYKKGKNTNDIYSRDIEPKDWMTPLGYQVRVWSQDERDGQDAETLNKLNAVKMNMPDNPVVDEEYKRKLVEFSGMPPAKQIEAMQYEEKKKEMMAQQGNQLPIMPQLPGQAGQPAGQPLQIGQPQQPGAQQPAQQPVQQPVQQ